MTRDADDSPPPNWMTLLILAAVVVATSVQCGSDTDTPVADDRMLPVDSEIDVPLADLVWTYKPKDPAISIYVNRALAAADGNIYFFSYRSEEVGGGVAFPILSSVDARGRERWHTPLPRAWIPTHPLVDSQGHIWVLANDFKNDHQTPFGGAVGYRVSPDGDIVVELALPHAPGDEQAADRGLRTDAAAIDADDNLYYVVGHSAVSLTPDGSVRWTALLEGGNPEMPCEQWLPWYSPIVIRDRVIFAGGCANFVFDLSGNRVAQFVAGLGHETSYMAIGMVPGALTLPLTVTGVEARDLSGAVIATWPKAAPQHAVIDGAGRLLAISQVGLGAWTGAETPWTYVPQWGDLYDWFADDEGFVFIGQSASGEITVVNADGEVVFDAAVGRYTGSAPVAAKEGQLVFITRSWDDAFKDTTLTCIRVPIGFPTTKSWSRVNRDFRNSRFLE